MRSLRRYVGSRVVVGAGGENFHGQLAEADKDSLTLASPSVVSETETRMDGTLVIPSAAIEWVQVT